MNTTDAIKRLARAVIALDRHVKPSTALTPSDADVAAWLDDRSDTALPKDGEYPTNIYERALHDVTRLATFLQMNGHTARPDEKGPVDVVIRIIREWAPARVNRVPVSQDPKTQDQVAAVLLVRELQEHRGARHPGEDVGGGVGATDGGH